MVNDLAACLGQRLALSVKDQNGSRRQSGVSWSISAAAKIKIGPAGCERRGRPGRDQAYLLAVPEGAGWTATVRQPNGKSGVSLDDVAFPTSPHAPRGI
jgi:hypothetical protein